MGVDEEFAEVEGALQQGSVHAEGDAPQPLSQLVQDGPRKGIAAHVGALEQGPDTRDGDGVHRLAQGGDAGAELRLELQAGADVGRYAALTYKVY